MKADVSAVVNFTKSKSGTTDDGIVAPAEWPSELVMGVGLLCEAPPERPADRPVA
jgi:hypothetical protein